MQRSEALYRVLFESAVDGVVLIDRAGTIQSVNPAVKRLFGYLPEELVGRNVRILMPPPFRDEHDGYLDRYLATGRPRIIGIGREVEGRRRDGTTFPLDLAVSEVRHGEELFFLGTLRDVSERRRMETEYRQAQKMEAIGRLAGGVAHDFNTLLGSIRGFSELLLGALPPDEPRRRHVEQIHRASLRGAELTRQLLAFSRRQEVEPRLVDPASLLEDLRPMLEPLLGEDLSLHWEVGCRPAVWVDPGLLEQAVFNLVVNARDAMPHGGRLTLAVGTVETDAAIAVTAGRLPPGSYVTVDVIDTGIGMDEETLPRIFDPFFTTKGLGKGTGLGLSMVLAFAERSRGGVVVESRPGQGSRFRLLLPRAEGRPEVEAIAAQPEPPAASAGGETVLLVEDDAMFRGLLREVLEGAGFEVLEAADPARARELAAGADGRIRLLLSDLVMPGGNGAELARELVAQDPSLKVVLMSGYADDSLESRTLDPAGADAFLEKPFATADLLRCLLGLLAGG